eukprot:10798855-Alexandrium_andersonii.AAC.1
MGSLVLIGWQCVMAGRAISNGAALHFERLFLELLTRIVSCATAVLLPYAMRSERWWVQN